MTADQIRVLHVDDEQDVLDLTAAFMEREAPNLTVDSVTSGAACLELFDPSAHDCIVSDFEMPEMDGLELLEAVREDHPAFPFVLFTGRGTEEIASRAIAAGVTDYLQKGASDVYPVLGNRVANAVDQYRSRRELVRFREAVRHAGHAVYMTDTDGAITYVNPVFEEMTGYTASEAVGASPAILNSGEHDAGYFQRLWRTISAGDVWYEEVTNRRKDGDRYTALQTIAPLPNGDGGMGGYVAIQQDVSEYRPAS